jgi:hypothetical protein
MQDVAGILEMVKARTTRQYVEEDFLAEAVFTRVLYARMCAHTHMGYMLSIAILFIL